MASLPLIFFSLVVAVLSATQRILAVEYAVLNIANTTGGARFSRDIGSTYTVRSMNTSTSFIWNTFQQTSPSDRKPVQRVGMFIDDMGGVAFTSDNLIHFSARYIGGYLGDLKTEFRGVVYHEMAHVWQWFGSSTQGAPGGLIEGIADYARLKAGLGPSHWVRPGQGNRWDQGYDVTARFLDYCNGLKPGFVAQLNKKMRTGYNNTYFHDLLGKTVEQLWADYKRAFPTA